VTDTAGSADGGPDGLRILAGSPTEEEAAAIAAVFAQLLLEQAVARAEVPAEQPPTRWERTMRPLRHWDRGPGTDWRSAI
jgi:Acyl-CoA carboxylase epsilon subunit